MSTKIKKKIVCSKCLLTPKFSLLLDKSMFKSECLDHNNTSDKIESFLAENHSECNFICQEHKPQHYIQFCTTCKKNVCPDCSEEHLDHENNLIYLHKIKPKKKEYEEFKSQLKIMKTEKDFIVGLQKKMIELQELINELYKIINGINQNIKDFFKEFKIKYYFNKSIFESYNSYDINYNSILNIKQFKFNKDEFYKFMCKFDENKLKFNQILENINIFNLNNCHLYTFINQKDYLNFKNNDGIKEVIKKQFDNILSELGANKELLIVENTGEEIEVFDKKTSTKKNMKFNYLFKKKDDNKIFGEIKYNNIKKELIISYIGELQEKDLLTHYFFIIIFY